MYFPYFRGRQFELIAIRELIEKDLIGEKVIPVIEPVKASSTLVKTLQTLKDRNKKAVFIVNPAVGRYIEDIEDSKNEALKNQIDIIFRQCRLVHEDKIIFGMILNNDLIKMKADKKKYVGEWAVISKNLDSLPYYEKIFSSEDVVYNLIPDQSSFRRRIRSNKIMLEDRFLKEERNIDYQGKESVYSEDHIFYREEKYVGFSDYSVVGDDYAETGFAPYAIAIHIVYFGEDELLRIKHFVSDSNSDITDLAGKFSEALEKLIVWNKKRTKPLETFGIKKLTELYEDELYPGLGTVKKLSIMHHLELISNYLAGDIK